MYVTRPTMIEKFNLLLTQDWMTQERFIEDLTKPFVTNPKMRLGTFIHKLIETRPVDEKALTDGEFTLHPSALEVINGTPDDVLREAAGRITIDTDYGPVRIYGHADSLTGTLGRDYKTSDKEPQLDMYQDSYQWRIYMWIFGLRMFEYDFIKTKADKEGLIHLERLTPLTMYAYPEQEKDICMMVNDFVGTMIRLGFEHLLKGKK